MKKLNRWYWIAGLLALTAQDMASARGGHGHGHHGHGHHGHGHRHGHFNLGITMGGFGPGFYGSGFYPYSYYAYPGPFYAPPRYRYSPAVIAPVTPPVYIQREQSAAAQPQTNYWHYCRNPEGYYPAIKNCPEGWIQVAPQPPAP
ncbi:MAG: hypothetical protein JSR32_04345 [Proteobacteria bacterium]|nr:hypothetical protein [Pseudomonadota bacterium]